MRLIDAESLRGAMYHKSFETDTDLQRWDSGCWIRYKLFQETIDEEPTVDAVPVRHGRWVELENAYECSFCGIIRRKGVTGHYLYCPNCGAKMAKEEE